MSLTLISDLLPNFTIKQAELLEPPICAGLFSVTLLWVPLLTGTYRRHIQQISARAAMAHLQRPTPRERQRQPLTQGKGPAHLHRVPQPCPAPSPARSAPSWTSRKVTRGRGGSLRDQLADSEQHIGRLQDNLRHEREKAQRLQTRCTQQAVDLRRSEQQSNRLKERLAKLADGHRGRRPSIDILNTLASAPGKETPSGMRSLGRREEEVLRVMLERREAELREDVQLRQCLTTLLCSLRADMERTLQDCVVAGGQGLDCKRLIQSEAALGDHVTGGVVQGWSKVQKRLADFISDGFSSVTMGTDQDKLLAQLETDLEQSEQLVRLQQQLLQDNVGAPLPPSLADSYYLEEWERLQAKWAEFESQRRSFQRERQAFHRGCYSTGPRAASVSAAEGIAPETAVPVSLSSVAANTRQKRPQLS
ncbi:hypothetical protein COCON_G00022890, partial [Conger conger]